MKLELDTEENISDKEADDRWTVTLRRIHRIWDKERDNKEKTRALFELIADFWAEVRRCFINHRFRYGFLCLKQATLMDHLIQERIKDENGWVIGYRFRPTWCWGTGDLMSVIAHHDGVVARVTFTYYEDDGNREVSFSEDYRNEITDEFFKFVASRIDRDY